MSLAGGDDNTGAGEDEGYASDQSSSTQQSKGPQPEPSPELSDDAQFDAATRAAIEASLQDLQDVNIKVMLRYRLQCALPFSSLLCVDACVGDDSLAANIRELLVSQGQADSTGCIAEMELCM